MLQDMIDTLIEQEKTLVFEKFSNEDALNIGNAIIDHIRKQNKTVAVEITVNGWQIYKHSMDGTRQENDRWLKRKRNMLNYRNTSSLLAQKLIEKRAQDIEKDLFLDSKEYSIAGGAFPINLAGRVIGSIVVSGLPDIEDHQTVVDVLKNYLNKEAPSVLCNDS